jgi:UDP:flavonoid glycosyltransferase YjiC (YdhE family)
MHAILVTLGTDGDVFPYVGLGATLRGRGHRVTLTAPESYQGLAAQHGLEFRSLVSQAAADEFLASPDLWHPIKSGLHGARWGARFIREQYQLLSALAHEADTILVTNPGVLASRLVQDRYAKPVATLLLQPGLLPSVCAPPVMPAAPLPRWAPHWARRVYWRLIDAAGDLLIGGELNRVRDSLGLPPVRRIFRWWLSPQLVIGMFPEWYAAPQPDWPPQLWLAGFPMFDGGSSAELPADLVDFCSAAAPPVAFTMGTGMMHGAEFFKTAMETCEMLGRRGILLTRFAQLVPTSLSPEVRHVAFAPFHKLLPLCAALVHHGGIGTTARALSAGTPQLVLPLAWDQPDNAARVRRLEAGSSLGPRRRSAAQLAEALAELLQPAAQARCRALRAGCGESNGLDRAAQRLEEFFESSQAPERALPRART